jgi:hypothetical protein
VELVAAVAVVEEVRADEEDRPPLPPDAFRLLPPCDCSGWVLFVVVVLLLTPLRARVMSLITLDRGTWLKKGSG